MLPRLCFNVNYGIGNGFYDIKVIFNDYRLIAQSSLLNDTKYEIELYEYAFKENPTFYETFGTKDLFHVDTRLVIHPLRIEPNKVLEIKNLKHGKYLFLVLILFYKFK